MSAALIKQDVWTGRLPRAGGEVRWLKKPRGAPQRRPPLHLSPLLGAGRAVSSFPASAAARYGRRPSEEAAAPTLLFLIRRGRRPPSGISGQTVTLLLG